MAPEVVRHEKYSMKCDVYSFAMVLYEIFEGLIATARAAAAAAAASCFTLMPPHHARQALLLRRKAWERSLS